MRGGRTGAQNTRPGSLPPALVLGEGISALAVVRSLGRSGVPVYTASADPMIARSRWYRPLSPIEESSEGRRLAAYLESLPLSPAVLFPCSDQWALAVAALPAGLAATYPAPVASESVLRVLVDKGQFADAASELSVPAPRTMVGSDVIATNAIDHTDFEGFFVKPADSQSFARRFGVKALLPGSRADVARLVSSLAAEGIDVLLQEYIPGPPSAHVFLDGFVDRHGVMRACLARRRLRVFPLEFGNSTLSETIPLADVGDALTSLRHLFDGLGYKGLFDAEFKYDERDGRFKIIEVNARAWWQLALAEACGLNLCVAAYRDALGWSVPEMPGYRVGRRWVHPLPDLRAWWEDRDVGGLPPRSWFGSTHAVFSLDDPLPALEELERVGKRLARVGRRRWAARRAKGRELTVRPTVPCEVTRPARRPTFGE